MLQIINAAIGVESDSNVAIGDGEDTRAEQEETGGSE